MPGGVYTATADLYDLNGTLVVGDSQWTRTVVDEAYDFPGFENTKVVRTFVQVVYEFGDRSDYYDNAIAVTTIVKRALNANASAGPWADHDGVITGGSGMFMGASGRVTWPSAPNFLPNNSLLQNGVILFEVWVPRLPLIGGSSTFPKANRSWMLHPLLSPFLLLVLGAKLLVELAV